FWAPPFGAVVTLPAGMTPGQLQQFDFFAGAVAYTQDLCRRTVAPHTDAQRAATGMPDDLVDLVCFSRDARRRVEARLVALGVEVLSTSSVKIRVKYDGDLVVLRDIEGVKLADVARAPVLLGQTTLAGALGATAPNGGWISTLDGSGELIAIADTGLD